MWQEGEKKQKKKMGGSACVSTLACTSSRAEISCDLLECAAYRRPPACSGEDGEERGKAGAGAPPLSPRCPPASVFGNRFATEEFFFILKNK